MKFSRFAFMVLAMLLSLALLSCGADTPVDLWESAIYRSDTALGDGEKVVTVKVITPEKTVTLTLHTDAETLGQALAAHDLIEGEDGLYIKVNGIMADYNIDQSYWSYTKAGEMMMIGMDDTVIADGDVYELTRTK